MTIQAESGIIAELFEFPYRDFKDHLETEGNNRILFSGKFGTGKSTFLHHYFNASDAIRNKYQVLHLFPVNYSVASNEDIFELIKYDIIINLLLDQKIPVAELEITNTVAIKYFIQENPEKLVKLLLSAIPKVGKDIADFINQIEAFKKSLDEYASKISNKTNESATLLNHIDALDDKTGSIYETNLVTGIIKTILSRHKENTNKEYVLIIDDLDRIDPDHIFRILNIFSAHFDERFYANQGTANKFGFDKVIIVCDIENIRRIFRNRFGQHVDFSGYIDKFFSSKPFHFQNTKQLQEFIVKHFAEHRYTISENPSLKRTIRDIMGPHNAHIFTEFLLTLVQQDVITLRKILSKEKTMQIRKIFVYEHYTLDFLDEKYLWVLHLLIQYAGGSESFLEGIGHMKSNHISLNQHHSFANILFFVVHVEQHKFKMSISDKLVVYGREKFKIRADNEGEQIRFTVFNTDDTGLAVSERFFTNSEIYDFIYSSVRTYRSLKLIE